MDEFFKKFWEKMRLLPLLIVVASLAFVVRVGDAAMEMRALSNDAQAADAAKDATTSTASKDSTKTEDKKVEDGKSVAADASKSSAASVAGSNDSKAGDAAKADVKTADKKDWKDAQDTTLDESEIRQDVYKDLMQRRVQLDGREKELQKREALVAATNAEITAKVKELTSLKTELEALLKRQNEAEDQNTARLVKIYEGMKPKDAARIFNDLDMDVLISVVSKMGEKKSALVIAAMDADKARRLTLMLSENKKLPDLTVKGAEDNGAGDVGAGSGADLPSLGAERDQTSASEPPPAPQ